MRWTLGTAASRRAARFAVKHFSGLEFLPAPKQSPRPPKRSQRKLLGINQTEKNAAQ